MSTQKVLDSEKNHLSLQPLPNYPESLDVKLQEVKNVFENWREVLIPLYKVLIWEKHWHPFAIAGVTTSIFLFIWMSDMSVLTLFSLIGLIATLCDYLVPIISSSFIKPDSWTPEKDDLLNAICGEILLIKLKIELDCSSYYRLRKTHPKMYVIITSLSLVVLAWIGNIFNNLLLAYVLVTSILLLPGAERTKVFSHIHEIQNRIFRDYVSPRFKQDKKE